MKNSLKITFYMIYLYRKEFYIMYDFSYYTPTVSSGFSGSMVWTIISFILAIIGGILVYVLFLNKNEKINNKFLSWLKDFLSFKTLLLETILKVTYVILAIFVTLTSFNLIGTSFVGFLLYLVLGNIILRIAYEGSLMIIMIWKNTKEINKKMK